MFYLKEIDLYIIHNFTQITREGPVHSIKSYIQHPKSYITVICMHVIYENTRVWMHYILGLLLFL